MKLRLLVAISLLLYGYCNEAQAASSGARDALLSWTRPAQYTDGTSITASTVVLYKVYRGAKGGAKTLVTSTQSLSLLLTDQPLGEQCYVVTASVGTDESAPSGEGCKTMRLPAPTDGAIEAPTDGSIEN